MADDIWTLIHPEREAIARDIEGLDEAAWQTRSLCPEWSVGQVFAHITTAEMMTPPRFLGAFASAGFRFNLYADRQIAKYYQESPAAAAAYLRSNIDRTTAPPGPKPTWIGEIVVHSEDIRRPLGIAHTYDPVAVRRAADFYIGSNVLIGSRDRIDGVRLEATDADWTHGTGPTVRGSLLAIVMAMTGRRIFLDDLEGDGVAVLHERA